MRRTFIYWFLSVCFIRTLKSHQTPKHIIFSYFAFKTYFYSNKKKIQPMKWDDSPDPESVWRFQKCSRNIFKQNNTESIILQIRWNNLTSLSSFSLFYVAVKTRSELKVNCVFLAPFTHNALPYTEIQTTSTYKSLVK